MKDEPIIIRRDKREKVTSVHDLFVQQENDVITIETNQIEPNPLNEAPIIDIEPLKQLIEENGQIDVGVAYRLDSGMYRLVSGERRWTALSELGYPMRLELISRPESIGKELELIDQYNEQRELTRTFIDSRIKNLAKAYDILAEEGSIPAGLYKRDFIELRMKGAVKASTIQKYLSGHVELDESKPKYEKKQFKLKSVNSTMSKLLKYLKDDDFETIDFTDNELTEYKRLSQELYMMFARSVQPKRKD